MDQEKEQKQENANVEPHSSQLGQEIDWGQSKDKTEENKQEE